MKNPNGYGTVVKLSGNRRRPWAVRKSLGQNEKGQPILKTIGYTATKEWLSFMQARLRIAHSLLSEQGIIFISIDDNEQANLKLLCDEIFGENNFFTQIIVQSNKRGQTYK